MLRRTHRLATIALAAALGAALAAGASPAHAQSQKAPVGTPVRWDQARVTQYAVELDDAVEQAFEQTRKDPSQIAVQQRQAWYDLKEDMRLLQNSSQRLKVELQKGAGQEETAATFRRIDSLRRNAEEHGRKCLVPAPVLDALTKAGSIHNRMRPYYYGKR
jgi:hypothetical protein